MFAEIESPDFVVLTHAETDQCVDDFQQNKRADNRDRGCLCVTIRHRHGNSVPSHADAWYRRFREFAITRSAPPGSTGGGSV